MEKLKVGLGYSVFELFLAPLRLDKKEIIDCISKQQTVLSDRIIDYYKMNAGDFSDSVDAYITANSGYDCFQYFNTGLEESASIEDEFVSIISQCPMKLMVTEEGEFKKKKLRALKVYSVNEVLARKDHPLKIYSLPVSNYVVDVGEKRDKYLTWFKHLMKDEHVIRIIDPYIITERGINILNDCYLPLIEDGVQIEIYGTDAHIQSWAVEDLNKKIHRDRHEISMYLIPRDEEHDRFIWAGDTAINIGRGLDFVDSKHEEIQRKTSISISKGKFKPPYVIRCVT